MARDLFPPDRDRLLLLEHYLEQQHTANQTVGQYLALQLDAVRARISALGQPARPPAAPARPSGPSKNSAAAAPEWVVESRRSPNGPEPVVLHRGDCFNLPRDKSGKAPAYGLRPVDAHEARELLTEGLGPCRMCAPDTALGID